MDINNSASFACLFFCAALSGSAWALEVGDPAEVSGVVELEYGVSRGDSGREYGPLATKIEVDAAYKPTDKVDLHTLLLYEDKQASVDEADITWHALPDEKLDITAGKKYLPFGVFKKAMISSPLTKKLAEARQEKVLLASHKHGDFQTQGYVFAGTSPQTGGTGKHDTGYGLSVGYKTEAVRFGVDYLSNLAETKRFENDDNDVASEIPAFAVHGLTKIGRVTLIGEHIAATKAFQRGDLGGSIKVAAKPATTQLEADIDLNNDRTVAFAWSGSSDAAKFHLAKEKLGVTYSQPLYKNLAGSLELMRSKDYDAAVDNALTAQLAYEF